MKQNNQYKWLILGLLLLVSALDLELIRLAALAGYGEELKIGSAKSLAVFFVHPVYPLLLLAVLGMLAVITAIRLQHLEWVIYLVAVSCLIVVGIASLAVLAPHVCLK